MGADHTSILTAGKDASGSVSTGGVAQVLAAANLTRRGLQGQNISTGDLWINETGGTAAAGGAGSFQIPPGATFSTSTNQAISVYGATTGQKWTATEY